MNFRKIAGVLLTILFLSSCNIGETKMVTKNAGDLFTVDVPEYMEELDLGNPYANIQYGNMVDEHYLVILREAKSDFLFSGFHIDVDYYAELQLEAFIESVDDPVITELETKTINGLATKNFEIDGILPENNLPIYYNFTFYESETAVYSLTTWTLAERERVHKENMYKIVNSLKEL